MGDDPIANGPNFRVLGMPDQGTFAEYICVPAENVTPKPEHLTWEETASIPVAGLTSWRSAVTHGEINDSKRILVTGAGGGVASFALLWGCIMDLKSMSAVEVMKKLPGHNHWVQLTA